MTTKTPESAKRWPAKSTTIQAGIRQALGRSSREPEQIIRVYVSDVARMVYVRGEDDKYLGVGPLPKDAVSVFEAA